MKPTSEEVINELCKILDATPKKINGFMTPKEKAKDLLDKMEKDFQYFASREIAIKHALIAVDEILKAVESDWSFMEVRQDYWKKVKQEIEKL
jgi:hypothetical protein